MGRIIKVFIFILFILFPVLLFAHDVTSADQETLNNGGLLSYVWVGAKHMITGYDHLLFLAGVIFFLKKFKDILKFITAFTIGHCVTLIGATYLQIQVNEYFIDAVIALSVLYKGFENLKGFERYLKFRSPNLLMMVFVFGLISRWGFLPVCSPLKWGATSFY